MTKLLIVAYYFPPMGGAGVQRVQKFARYLPSEGYLPVVVAGPDMAAQGWPQDQALLAEIPKEVRINRVTGPPPPEGTKAKRRLESLLSQRTPFSKWWIHSATELAVAAGKDCGFIFATMPPFENAAVAAAASQRLGIPWVADLRDPWAVDEIQVYPSWAHHKLELSRMGSLLSTASLIVMNTPEAAAALKRAFPKLNDSRVMSITNGFDGDDFELNVPARTDGKFRIVHAGSLLTEAGMQIRGQRIHRAFGGIRKDVDVATRSGIVLMEAIAKWLARSPEVSADLEMVFAGKRSKHDEALAASCGLTEVVRFVGYLSHTDSLGLIRTADLLFLPMHNLPEGKRATTVPGKLYEYIASGRAILAAVPDGDASDFLTQSGTASICRPDGIEGMIGILDKTYKAWKSGQAVPASNRAFVGRFERQALTRVLATAFTARFGTETAGNVERARQMSKDVCPV
jgi:glycosyltransferase involved in cell wall biosynthesis